MTTEHTAFELILAGFFMDYPLVAWTLLALVILGAFTALTLSIAQIVRHISENRIRSMSVRGFRRRKAELSRS